MSVEAVLAELNPLDDRPPASYDAGEYAQWHHLNEQLGVELRNSVLSTKEAQMAKYDPEKLATEHSTEDLVLRRDSAAERIETRINRAQTEVRDLTDRETSLSKADVAEVKVVERAIELRERMDEKREKGQQVFAEMHRMREGRVETRAAAEISEQLAAFDAGLREGVPQRTVLDVEVYTRAATTATTGDTTAVSARSGRPPFIWSALRIPIFPAATNSLEGPTWAPLVAQAATAEGGTKPVMADATLDSQTLGAYAVTHTVSDRVIRFGVGEDAVSARLSAEAVFSANGGIIDRWETLGTEIAFATDAPTSVDTAIARVVSRTGGATGIVLHPDDYPALAARSATSAQDVESGTVAGYNGLAIFMHENMATGHAIVVNGMWLSAHSTGVLLASLPLLATNEVMLRGEVYAAVLLGDASAVQRVDIAAA